MPCHEGLKLKNDPVDVSHKQLIQEKNWDSCLTCHDYHGNQDMKPEVEINKGIALPELKNYFNRGSNPYPGKIIYKAKVNEKQ